MLTDIFLRLPLLVYYLHNNSTIVRGIQHEIGSRQVVIFSLGASEATHAKVTFG